MEKTRTDGSERNILCVPFPEEVDRGVDFGELQLKRLRKASRFIKDWGGRGCRSIVDSGVAEA